MTNKKFQKIFSKNITKIINLAQEYSSIEGKISGLTDDQQSRIEKNIVPSVEKESEDFGKDLRMFDDLDSKVDSVLTRRFLCSNKFKEAVEEIRAAFNSGVFIINIVAPEYQKYKGLVDLVLSEAMIEKSSVIESKNLNPEKIDQIESDRKKRYDKMLGSIVADIGVEDFSSRGVDSQGFANLTFFGTPLYDPKDPVNACFCYLDDYSLSANAEIPDGQSQDSEEKSEDSPRMSARKKRLPAVFEHVSPIKNVEFSAQDFVRKSRGNILYSSPMSAPPESEVPEVIYYDERPTLLRFDPDVESSYEFPDMSSEIDDREGAAAEKIRDLIENGMENAPAYLRQKWGLFVKLLSSLQGDGTVSMFHYNGFDEDGNPKEFSIEFGASKIKPQDLNVSIDLVEKILNDFLSQVTLSSKVTKEKMKEAIVDSLKFNMNPIEMGPVKKEVVKKLSADELSKKSPKEISSYLAEKFLEENPDKTIASSDGRVSFSQKSVMDWMQSANYGDLVDKYYTSAYQYAVRIVKTKKEASSEMKFKKVSSFTPSFKMNGVIHIARSVAENLSVSEIRKQDVLKQWIKSNFGEENEDCWSKVYSQICKASNNFSEVDNGFVKEASIKKIKTTPLYEKLFDIIKKDETVRAYEPIKAALTAEYILDLFVKYIYRKCSTIQENDYESIKSSGISPNVGISGINSLVIMPFDNKQKMKFGISTPSQIDEVFKKGTQLRLSSPEYSDVVIIKSVQYSETKGVPSLRLVFDNVPVEKYEPGNYVVTLVDSNASIEGLVDDVYNYAYRGNSSLVKKQHETNGVSLNLSIYPPWAPSPFDYRRDTGDRESGGHPNNAYNLQLALNKRISLRERYIRKASYREDAGASIARALRRLEQEIGEIKNVLSYVEKKVPSVRLNKRDSSNSMLRDNNDPVKNSSFYQEVISRCSKEGIEIGRFGPTVGPAVIKSFLPPEEYNRFLQISDEVYNNMKGRKNVLILRHVDFGIKNQNGNGFLKVEQSESGGVGGKSFRAWDSKFKSEVVTLYNEIAKTADPSSRKAHLVIISEAKIPSFFSSEDKGDSSNENMRSIYIATNTISTAEIEALFQYYQVTAIRLVEDDIRQELLTNISEQKKKELEAKMKYLESVKSGEYGATGMTVPMTVIRKSQSLLANLGFGAVEAFIKKTCVSLMKETLKIAIINQDGEDHASASTILDLISGQVDEDIEKLREKDEVLSKLGIKTSAAKVGLEDYVVESGTAWASHVNSTLSPIINEIADCNNKIDFFRRCLDLKILPGNFELGEVVPIKNEETGKMEDRQTVVFDVPLSSGDSKGGLYWFDCDLRWGRAINSCLPLDKTLSGSFGLAGVCGFHVQDDFVEFAMKDSKLKKYNEDENFTGLRRIVTNISACISKVSNYVRELEDRIAKVKGSYPTFIVLEGDPGTGKSIFAEVLAKSLDCKFMVTTFDEVFYSAEGQPKFRGGMEENITKFFDVLPTLNDTILLIDEIDKFLVKQGLDSSKGDVDKVLAIMQSRWETGASATSDVGKYKKNNLHLVLTTNDWSAIEKAHSALATRLKPTLNVPLPSSVDTLKKLFTGSAIVNNLINSKCNSNNFLTELTKILKDIYDKTDEESIRMKNEIIIKIRSIDPSFFTSSSILTPRASEREFADSRSVAYKKEIDEVDDFVRGWKMVENLIASLSKPEKRIVDGKETQFVPLDLICNKLSQILVFKGRERTYARGNMRELMTIFMNLLSLHDEYLRGRNRAPFNYKTLYTAISLTRFRLSTANRNIADEDIRAFRAEAEKVSVDGVDFVKNGTGNKDDDMLPSVEYWYTENNFSEVYDRENQFIVSSGIDVNGDGGFQNLMYRCFENLYLTEPGKPPRKDPIIDIISAFIKEMITVQKGAVGVSSLNQLFNMYMEIKEDIQNIYNEYVKNLNVTSNSDLLERLQEAVVELNSVVSQMNDSENLSLFNSPRAKPFNAAGALRSFNKRMSVISGSFDSTISLFYAKQDGGKETAWNNINKKNIEKIKNASDEIVRFSKFNIEQPISQEEFDQFFVRSEKKELPRRKTKEEIKQLLAKKKGITLSENKTVPKEKIMPNQTPKNQEDLTEDQSDANTPTFPIEEKTDIENQEETGEFDEVPLNIPASKTVSSTDYYYKIAAEIINKRKAQLVNTQPTTPNQQVNPVQNFGFGTDFFDVDFSTWSAALENRNRIFSEISGLPFSIRNPLPSGNFFKDVNVLKIPKRKV